MVDVGTEDEVVLVAYDNDERGVYRGPHPIALYSNVLLQFVVPVLMPGCRRLRISPKAAYFRNNSFYLEYTQGRFALFS